MAPAHAETDPYVVSVREVVGEDARAPFASPCELLSQVAISLIEAGFEIHDCAARARTGGVCLTPSSHHSPGVIVTWTPHDALAEDDGRYAAYRAVLDTMNFALGDVLLGLGYDVREYGQAGANLVVSVAPAEPAQKEAATRGGE